MHPVDYVACEIEPVTAVARRWGRWLVGAGLLALAMVLLPAYTVVAQTAPEPELVGPGERINFVGGGFAPNSEVEITVAAGGASLGRFSTDLVGRLNVQVTIPIDTPAGFHDLVATGVDGDGEPYTFTMPIEVLQRSDRPASLVGVFLAVATMAGFGVAIWVTVRRTRSRRR